ncbi:molybdopterin-dependent oxidoreductase [Rhizobium sp. EC-SD404]|uniref:molybdopterin-dependent oxidoreductase n=1 Tax=Rhizobium sp. EC-SD404 TaxID=2038389 RepID=UPI001256ED8B|nr:molybdopterin-dependent oxidoreductase [Rhizobium sp. EC-SD404]VVT18793.1 Oxidoreductase molybdopterin binding domain-containing protein [Rhizobium sp. EC-SD404]
MTTLLSRRRLITGAALTGSAMALSGCDALGQSPAFRQFLSGGEWLSYRIQRFIVGDALAREYPEGSLSPTFCMNGNTRPENSEWERHAASAFSDYRLRIDGLVARPQSISMAEIRTLPARTQITRHDCVEGWSAIGKWTGTPLGPLLDRAELAPNARYIVFHCADDFRGTPYYESIDLVEAFHPQTILAYGMNDGDLPIGHGAPLRLRVERQLGYKQAKFVMRIEAVESLDAIGRGRGGYWEDAGAYDWYAGI